MHKLRFFLLLGVFLVLPSSISGPAHSAEFGTGIYLLGFQSSMAGYLPPPGFYLRNDFYWYQGNADILPFSRAIEANLRGRMFLDLVTATYVTPLKFGEISYAAGMIWVAFGNNFIKGQLDVGGTLSRSREGDYSGVGDLILTPLILGWHSDIFISSV